MPKWKTKLPFWNTGRVYATTASKWDAAAYGMVCTGSRDVLIGEHFARLVCHDNGFDQLDFYGHQVDYVAFIDGQREALGDQVDYLASVYNQTEQFDAPFIVSGAKCDADNDDLNTCTILDYRKLGGNCMANISSLFVHCSGYRYTSEMAIGSITPHEYDESLQCDGCNKKPYVVNYICGDGQRMTESAKNNRVCADCCFVKMDYCSNDCSDDYSSDYYMSDEYYDLKKGKMDYDYSYSYNHQAKRSRKKKQKSTQSYECGLADAKHDYTQYCPAELAQGLKNQLCDSAHHRQDDFVTAAQFGGFLSTIHIGALMLMFCFIFFIGFVIVKWNHLRRSVKYTETPQIQYVYHEPPKVQRSETTKSEFDRTRHTEQTQLLS